MTNKLEETLGAMGYAKVLVTLADGALETAEAQAAALAPHFILPPQALELAAVAARTSGRDTTVAPSALRVFPRLGLAIGHVDRAGATHL